MSQHVGGGGAYAYESPHKDRTTRTCVLGWRQSATTLSLSISPHMMDSNSGENKTKHFSCCHHSETRT